MLVAAYHDSLRVIRGQRDIDYKGDLEPVIQETEDLSQPLGEVWTNGLQARREMEREYRTVVHKERYVSPEGVSTRLNTCFRLYSRGYGSSAASKGLEQATHTFGIIRSL